VTDPATSNLPPNGERAVLRVRGPVRPGHESVEGAIQLRSDLTARLDDLVAGLAGDADPGDIYVGWVAAAEVAACPARFRAGGADGWGFPGWSPPLAAAAVGRVALARHLDRHVVASQAAQGATPALPQPLQAVKAWMKEAREAPTSKVAEWVTDLSQQQDRAALAATAGLAARWVAGFVRVVGWPLPDDLRLVVDDPGSPSARRGERPWRPKLAARRVPVAVASKPDAVVGTVAPSGQFDLLFHRPTSSDDVTLAERADFEAAAWSLAVGLVPRAIVVTTGDTGEQLRFPVDPTVLTRGADLIAAVVEHRLRAAEPPTPDHDPWSDALPGSACRWCPTHDTCPPGTTHLTRPARWHNGLPVLTG